MSRVLRDTDTAAPTSMGPLLASTPKLHYSQVAMSADVQELGAERRRFPRVKAPMFCRPAHRRLPRREVVDVGVGGMRVYSDEPHQVGSKFEVEMFLAEGETITCLTEVVWIRKVEGGDPAPYDLGLSFLHIPPKGRDLLLQALEAGVPLEP